MNRFALINLSLACVAIGCAEPLKEQAKPDPNVIIGKTTNKVEKFDPNAGHKEAVQKVDAKDPIRAPLQAYGPAISKISKMHIKHAIDLFQAEHGRYPKDHDEFMEKIMPGIQLPKLPGGLRYAYDEKTRELRVIEAAK